jgi:predicted NACHT family NTPase
LKAGKVWLLLDGADEMTVADALQHIATQMRGMWLQNVRVVLTCRLNVWEAGKNALDNFDVYRNLDFEYPDEVHQFIDKWFQDEPDLQQTLKAALEQPGKERIRDMVKNPLRLTLLCYSWQIRQGELPETKAGLYEWFVDAFYEWNKGKVPYKLTSAKRKELNQALGELAREAIDQNSSRFRLTEKFIIRFLGDADDEDSLFHLALQLGWLNRIGVAAENPFEGVYAFLHPTFQEYFAALAIDELALSFCLAYT